MRAPGASATRAAIAVWLSIAAGACIDVAERRGSDPGARDGPDAAAPEGEPAASRRPGGAVRVVALRDHAGFAAFVGVWIHREDGQIEHLELRRGGDFEWRIDRNGVGCTISGTVEMVDGAPPSLAWTMTVNTCNSSYQGKTASDLVVDHDFERLVLKDAEFDLEPVTYDRAR
jgi:hypothetical protein